MVLEKDGNAVPTCVNARAPGSSRNARVLGSARGKQEGRGGGCGGVGGGGDAV